MRITVTGRSGQIVQSLLERADASSVEISTLARPELDFTHPHDIDAALKRLRPDAVVNAAAYTAVDLAEREPDLARQVNAIGPGVIAQATAKLGIPIVQLSTDYVFDGTLHRPYREDDATGPVSVYGRTKLEGEFAVAKANKNSVILRTAWVYSSYGTNFVRTMLMLGTKREEIHVVSDQIGAPTYALDIADGIISVVKNLIAKPNTDQLRGVFHMTAAGQADWAQFAERIFSDSDTLAGPVARVVPILTAAYPTLAKRPANSRLDNSRLANLHSVRLPHWRQSLPGCIERLVSQDYKKKDHA